MKLTSAALPSSSLENTTRLLEFKLCIVPRSTSVTKKTIKSKFTQMEIFVYVINSSCYSKISNLEGDDVIHATVANLFYYT